MTFNTIPGKVKKYGDILAKGVLIEMAPELAKGLFVEMFHIKIVDVKKVCGWVQDKTILWEILEPQHQQNLKKLAGKLGKMDWLDADWAINALKDDFPALASLFMGWPKAKNWLGRQTEIIADNLR